MPLASSLTSDSRFIALFVGAKHSGKTSAACSWLSPPPSKKRLKVLDGDGRIRGILGCPWIDRSRIDYDFYPPRMPGNSKTFFQRVNDDLELMLNEFSQNRSPYETYLGDSITAFARNLVQDALPLTHEGKAGRSIGTMDLPGPNDYNFEVNGVASYAAFLKSIPINVIVTAHIEERWDKPIKDDGTKDTYADSIVVGEQISLRPKVRNGLLINFDHIFKFERRIVGKEERFFVEFVSDLACTSFLGFKPGKFDITGVSFKEFVMNKVRENSKEKQADVSTQL